VLVLAACRSAASTGINEARADKPPARTGASTNGVAVVELFTSEGCSSCPPADAVLADLVGARGGAVYALAFHVDYWDDLGWPDRFASPDNTARQRAYARSFGTSGVYTPQMIVNGVEPFTGSNRARADQSIARALAQPATVALSVRARPAGSDAIAVDYDAPNAPPDAMLDVALVQRSASTEVRAGENAGRTLRHTNIVVVFVVAPLPRPTGSVVVHVPAFVRRDNGDVIAYVQRPSAGEGGIPVLGSARTAMPH
jgi:hypothetical protein